MAIKHFENSGSNSRDLRMLCVAGLVVDSSNSPIEAYPGMLVTPTTRVPSTAYTGKTNPNSWYMTAADADSTEVYVVCPDVASFGSFGDYTYNLGIETLGVPQPAGELTRCIRLEAYTLGTWGDAWFASAPSETDKYATINSDGLWAPTSTKPTSGIYIEILDTVAFSAGSYAAGTGYLAKIFVLPAAE